ncbi:MAG: SsrA-binding protein SmpB [Actinobacteria bacterium]|nr:SsrA-binding protein SmpB [Actinomycetota bacterium]NDA78691.1 SsrA-binding protein SmpB [Actinomycetota bacterium]
MKKSVGLIVKNRKAHFDYFIEEEFVAGIQLLGSEVKSIRNGDIQINDSFVEVRGGECFLVNCHIKCSSSGGFFSHEINRSRKLLLRKTEIKKLIKQVTHRGFTCVPLEVIWVNHKVKIKIGVVRGKKNYDKRQSIKERDLDRDIRES